jgi:hypothetical protein
VLVGGDGWWVVGAPDIGVVSSKVCGGAMCHPR